MGEKFYETRTRGVGGGLHENYGIFQQLIYFFWIASPTRKGYLFEVNTEPYYKVDVKQCGYMQISKGNIMEFDKFDRGRIFGALYLSNVGGLLCLTAMGEGGWYREIRQLLLEGSQ